MAIWPQKAGAAPAFSCNIAGFPLHLQLARLWRPATLIMSSQPLLEQRIGQFFDPDFYLQEYYDIAQAGVSPLDHYVKLGWREQRRPNRWFTEKMVPASLQNQHPTTPPFVLFLTHLPGMTEARFAALCASGAYADIGHDDCWMCDLMRSEFDGAWYRGRYGDVLEGAGDALAHFCALGWKERRNPNTAFDTGYYLDVNADVADAGIHPYAHYLSKGRQEGRKPAPEDAVRRRQLHALQSFPVVSQQYRGIVPELQLVARSRLLADLFSAAGGSRGLCLSASHDNYLKHTGGVQRFLHEEHQALRERGYVYVHLCPALPDIRLLTDGNIDTFLVNCSIDGKPAGTFTAREIREVLSSVHEKRPALLQYAVLHSAMGWLMDAVLAVMELPFLHRYFYAHDYFALCGEYRLLRNNVASCGAPPAGSAACGICLHGRARAEQLHAFDRYFERVKPLIIYPSETARAMFAKAGRCADLQGVVLPHIEVRSTGTPQPLARERKDIRVAFCGAPVAHKGFFHFQEMVSQCSARSDLKFYHFGNQADASVQMEFVKTTLRGGQSTMSEALREHGIDLVFVGSTWAETFNYIAYEAVQAGAALLTLDSAGNAAEFVRSARIGACVPHWRDAVALLVDASLGQSLDQWQAEAAVLEFKPNQSFMTEGVFHDRPSLLLHLVQ